MGNDHWPMTFTLCLILCKHSNSALLWRLVTHAFLMSLLSVRRLFFLFFFFFSLILWLSSVMREDFICLHWSALHCGPSPSAQNLLFLVKCPGWPPGVPSAFLTQVSLLAHALPPTVTLVSCLANVPRDSTVFTTIVWREWNTELLKTILSLRTWKSSQ